MNALPKLIKTIRDQQERIEQVEEGWQSLAEEAVKRIPDSRWIGTDAIHIPSEGVTDIRYEY